MADYEFTPLKSARGFCGHGQGALRSPLELRLRTVWGTRMLDAWDLIGGEQCRHVRKRRKTEVYQIGRFTTTFYCNYNQVCVEIPVRKSDTDFVRGNKSLRRSVSSQQHNKVVVVDAELVALMLQASRRHCAQGSSGARVDAA